MHSELYTDGVEEITVSGSIVRVDLVSLSLLRSATANNAPKTGVPSEADFSRSKSFANFRRCDAERAPGSGGCRRGPAQPAKSVGRGLHMSRCRPERTPPSSNPPRSPNASSNFPLKKNGTLTGRGKSRPDEAPRHGASDSAGLSFPRSRTHHGVDLPVERFVARLMPSTARQFSAKPSATYGEGCRAWRAQSVRIDWSALFPAGRSLSGSGASQQRQLDFGPGRAGAWIGRAWSPSKSLIRWQSARMRH